MTDSDKVLDQKISWQREQVAACKWEVMRRGLQRQLHWLLAQRALPRGSRQQYRPGARW